MKHFQAFLLLIMLSSAVKSQPITQTIRGKVVDRITQTPIPGVNVILVNENSATATDVDGLFKIEKVKVGNQTIRFISIGYEEQTISNIVLNSGKELVLTLEMDEKVNQLKEITVTDEIEKNKALNEMAMVSARTFSVEETQKFAAAINDPARMASSFAGVVSADDGNNFISIRGNSPSGLQWRMEGVDIPNPNHFAIPGASGGGISILSSQLLTNSDFLTGAFPAEYGNALSGVFDLRLRKGNNEKREYTVQAGFLGLDISTEGPFSPHSKGSYLINYRYSTLSAISKIVNIGDAVTNFQDLSFNFYLPTQKAGNFSLFGFGGLSSQTFDAKKDSTLWDENEDERYGSDFKSKTAAVGLTHSIILDPNTYLKSSLSYSDEFTEDLTVKLQNNYLEQTRFDAYSGQTKICLASTLNHKFNSRHSIRNGIKINRRNFDLKQKEFNTDINSLEEYINTSGNAYTLEAFTAWSYRLTEKFTLNTGLHFMEFMYNQTNSIEPRVSVKYQLNEKQSVALGYGLHSQVQPIGVYFAEDQNSNLENNQPNKNIDLSKSHHLVLSYDYMVNPFLHLKAETYYQHLYHIPVTVDNSKTFSMVNELGGYVTEPLVNNGTGRNYGMELTLEQFLHNDFYFILSSSLYDSKYKAANEKMYNTRYNGNYAFTFTSGKEIKTGDRFGNRIIGLNVKLVYTGGLRDTPIDLEQSRLKGETVYDEQNAFSIKNPDYFRTDIRLSVKRNRIHSTHTFSLDIQNATNRKNVYGNYYNSETGNVKTYYQTPLIPVLSYRAEF